MTLQPATIQTQVTTLQPAVVQQPVMVQAATVQPAFVQQPVTVQAATVQQPVYVQPQAATVQAATVPVQYVSIPATQAATVSQPATVAAAQVAETPCPDADLRAAAALIARARQNMSAQDNQKSSGSGPQAATVGGSDESARLSRIEERLNTYGKAIDRLINERNAGLSTTTNPTPGNAAQPVAPAQPIIQPGQPVLPAPASPSPSRLPSGPPR
jgi:hypothetical protein